MEAERRRRIAGLAHLGGAVEQNGSGAVEKNCAERQAVEFVLREPLRSNGKIGGFEVETCFGHRVRRIAVLDASSLSLITRNIGRANTARANIGPHPAEGCVVGESLRKIPPLSLK
jgi:hypothetical protein